MRAKDNTRPDFDDSFFAPDSVMPEEAAQSWVEPVAGQPIIDAARVPLRAFNAHKPRRSAFWMFTWLHYLRPVLVAGVWLVVAWYVWNHFFALPRSLEVWELVALYVAGILSILLVMLLLAPLRRREEQSEETQFGDSVHASTFPEMADYAGMPQRDLASVHLAQRVVVHHDEEGHVSRLDMEPVEAEAALAAARARGVPALR